MPPRRHGCPTEQATASVDGFQAPVHCRRHRTRPVSYYALFEGWLLLSQPPGCLCAVTSLHTKPSVWDLSRWSGLFPSRQRSLAPAVSLQRLDPAAFVVGLGLVSGLPPSPNRALPPLASQVRRLRALAPTLRTTAPGCPSRHFGENQLSPRSLGISPLSTAHPKALQRPQVRPSSPHYRTFSLAMDSSRGFGSHRPDLPAPPQGPADPEEPADPATPRTRPLLTRFRSGSTSPDA